MATAQIQASASTQRLTVEPSEIRVGDWMLNRRRRAVVSHGTDTYPVWTVRFTWRVTGQDDKPLHTFDGAKDESRAMDRAVFMLDNYRNSAARELVCVHIKRPDGTWSEMPRSNTCLSTPIRFAFQRPPVRPA